MRLGGRGSQTSGLDTMGDLVEIMRIGGHHSLLIAACCEGGRGGLEMGPRPSLIVISEETRGAQARGAGMPKGRGRAGMRPPTALTPLGCLVLLDSVFIECSCSLSP